MASTYYQGINDDGSGWALTERWPDVQAVVDLRKDDHVLDIGCAEGLISLEVAQRVRTVRAIEIEPDRIANAKALQRERGVENVTFEVGSVCQIDLQPLAYDVVLFLGVYHHLAQETQVPALTKLLMACKRHFIMRTPLLRPPRPSRLQQIHATCRTYGFEALLTPNKRQRGGDLVVAHRQVQPAISPDATN